MRNLLNEELDNIEMMKKRVLRIVELSNYGLGVNLAPKRLASWPCIVMRTFAIVTIIWTIVSLVNFVVVHSLQSFEIYAEAVLLTFQLTAALLKTVYLIKNLPVLQRLLNVTESGALLRDLSIFQLELPNKSVLREEIGGILRESWQRINKQVMFFFKVVCMPVMYYNARPYLQYVYDCNISQTAECAMTLTYPAIVPYWKIGNHEYPAFSLRFFLLQMGPVWCGFTVFGLNSVFVVMTLHEVGVLRVLRHLVSHSADDARVPKPLRAAYLRSCANLFLRLTKYHAEVENAFKYIILVQCVFSCVLLCMVLYNVSWGLNMKLAILGRFMVYFLVVFVEITLYNVPAQRVATESEKMCFAWYDCTWFNESSDFKFIVRMMIMFTNRTFVLSVGGFTNLSLQFLVQVFRLSGNFFLLIRNVNGK